MRCGSCGWDNPSGIIFCTNCGKRMSDRAQAAGSAVVTSGTGHVASPVAFAPAGAETPIYCGRCGAESARGLRFCRECGAALQAAPAAPSPVAALSDPPREATECWRCRAPRDGGAPFCRYCGAQLGDAAAFAASATPSVPAAPVAVPGPMSATGLAVPPLAPTAKPGVPRLVTLLKDGSEGRSIPLGEGDADIGAQEGAITFPDDPYLSPRHARISCRGGTYTLRDLDSVNGVYVRLREPIELRDRDMVLIGQQVLRFELLQDGELPLGPAYQGGVLVFGTPEAPRFARLVQYTTEGVGRDVHYLFRDETVIGRENGDIVFTDDPFLSRRHAAIRVDHAGRRFTLHDLGSSNGTAARIRGEHVLRDGDQFRIGRHLFRFEAGAAGGRAGR